MPTPPATPLVSGLGGAIGGDFRAVWNRLYFVEFDGKLSRLDLIPRARIIRSGTLTIPGTHTLDLDTGTLSPAGDAADLWWQQMTTSTRQLTPVNGAEVHRIGPANYARLTCARLMALAYTTDPVSGTPGSGNRMTPGTVVAVRTNRENYAKLQVRSSGYDLQIRFTTYRPSPAYRILGTGYQQPEDVALSADGTRAWITERTGNLLRVELSSPGRSSATVVASGLTAPHQIALDEAHGRAYVVEHASNGRLLRIDLATGNVTTLLTGLSRAVGLLLDAEGTSAWISEQGSTPDTGRIVRHRLDSGHSEPVATGLVNPFFLRWTDPAETGILVAERDPANRITRVETATGGGPVTTRVVAAGVPARPSSVALISETDLLVLSDAVVSRVALAEAVLDPGGPLLLGIGHVPAERISRGTNPARAGYADTTQLTNYFFQVRHAPFGGTLPIMVNFPAAWAAGARHYKLFVNGVEPRQGWTDLRWSTSVNRFVTQQVNPDSGGYYRVRPPHELWYHPFLGYRLDTPDLGDGHRTVELRFYTATNMESELGGLPSEHRTVPIQVDNTRPQVSIDQVLHNGSPVGACGIVDSGPDAFAFRITARGIREHLLNWDLVALWGDNRSKPVASDAYEHHASASRRWAGITDEEVPQGVDAPWVAAVPGDPTSTRCAHTFRLVAWNRTIDGWSRLYREAYHTSITLMMS